MLVVLMLLLYLLAWHYDTWPVESFLPSSQMP
jgi:hypothetical protein